MEKTNKDSNLIAGTKATSVASYVLMGKVLTYAMTGIAVIVVAGQLGPAQYGIYTLAIAFGGIFGSIGYFGIGTALNKFVSEYKQKNRKEEIGAVISSSLLILVATGLILGSLCLVFSDLISQYVFHTGSLSYVIRLVALYIVTAMLFGAFYDTLLGFGSGKHVAVVACVEAVVQATVSIVLAIGGFGVLALFVFT